MFGISFSELGLIMAVALVVLGPARLPGLVRKVGRWIGKARTMARDFQQQLENEINLDELNRMTEKRSKESAAQKPAADAQNPDLSQGAYPYGPREPVQERDGPESASATNAGEDAAAKPGDDTFSHAHAPGEPPAAAEPVADAGDGTKGSSAV